MIYTIYQALNIVNGKSYIGFDSHWPARKRHHELSSLYPRDRHYHSKFHRAMRKYGRTNFIWTVLYQSKDTSGDKNHTLAVMEPHFISQYDSYRSGYNSTLGGDGALGYKHTEAFKQWCRDRAGTINRPPDSPETVDLKRISGKKRFQCTPPSVQFQNSMGRGSELKPIATPHGTFSSIKEAAETLNIHRETIAKRCYSTTVRFQQWYFL